MAHPRQDFTCFIRIHIAGFRGKGRKKYIHHRHKNRNSEWSSFFDHWFSPLLNHARSKKDTLPRYLWHFGNWWQYGWMSALGLQIPRWYLHQLWYSTCRPTMRPFSYHAWAKLNIVDDTSTCTNANAANALTQPSTHAYNRVMFVGWGYTPKHSHLQKNLDPS